MPFGTQCSLERRKIYPGVSESPFDFLSIMGNHHSRSELGIMLSFLPHTAKYTESWPLGF